MTSICKHRRSWWCDVETLARALLPIILIIQFLLALFACGGKAFAQDSSPSQYQVEAAFLYNFGKFIEWPTNAFADDRAPLVIGVYGGDSFHGDLERIVAHKSINGHPLAVQQFSALSDLKDCHILFVSVAGQKQAADILNTLHDSSVLIVTENMNHFAESGFMINFFMKDEKIRFEINDTAATQAGLKISSKLLALGRRPER